MANKKSSKKPVNKKNPKPSLLPSAKEPERPYRKIVQVAANKTYYEGQNGTLYVVEAGVVRTDLKREFWVKEVSRGWGTTGSKEVSRRYERYYPQGFEYRPLQVTAQFRTDEDLQDFAEFVQVNQIRSAGGNPMSKLSIPAAGVQVFGYIPEIEVGAEAQGFLHAPEVQFEFQVTKDKALHDSTSYAQQIIAYYMNPKDAYWSSQRIEPVGTLLEIDSETQAAIDRIAEATRNASRALNKKEKITKQINRGASGAYGWFIDVASTGAGEIAKMIERTKGMLED